MIIADGYVYEIIEDMREGFKEEAFLARYSDILSRYDYIVGDWGYGQLRLKGFFDDKNQKSTFDTKISTIEDYLYEYCNFGCAYFIVQKTGRAPERPVEENSQHTDEVLAVNLEA
ncbi:MAG: YutD family protein [Solibacillus sp.]